MNLLDLLILAGDLGINMYSHNGRVLCHGKVLPPKEHRSFNRAAKRHKDALVRMLRKPIQDGLTDEFIKSIFCEGK